jgi:hypothetical protein
MAEITYSPRHLDSSTQSSAPRRICRSFVLVIASVFDFDEMHDSILFGDDIDFGARPAPVLFHYLKTAHF